MIRKTVLAFAAALMTLTAFTATVAAVTGGAPVHATVA